MKGQRANRVLYWAPPFERCWVLAYCGAMSGKEGKGGKRGKFTASLMEKKFVRRAASILSTAGRRVAKKFPTFPSFPLRVVRRTVTQAARDRCDPHQPRIVVYCSRFRRRGGCRFRFLLRQLGGGRLTRNCMPERKFHPIYGHWPGGTPSYASRCSPGSSAKRPCHRPRACRPAGILLDRGWGKATRRTRRGGGEIRVVIRQIIDCAGS